MLGGGRSYRVKGVVGLAGDCDRLGLFVRIFGQGCGILEIGGGDWGSEV